jgi:putative transposase
MKTYSTDLRERVVQACDEEMGTREEIAQLFGVSTAWIRRLLQRRRETGRIAAKPRGGQKPSKFQGKNLDKLKALVEAQPYATLQELLERSRVAASLMAVHRALERLGCHRKKRRSVPPSKTGRT